MAFLKQRLRLVLLILTLVVHLSGQTVLFTRPSQGVTLITFACCVYTPTTVSIPVGDVVQWSGDFSFHPLVSEDNLWSVQNAGSTFDFTFMDPGTYRFYCQIHGAPGGVGMSGQVMVTTSTFLPLIMN